MVILSNISHNTQHLTLISGKCHAKFKLNCLLVFNLTIVNWSTAYIDKYCNPFAFGLNRLYFDQYLGSLPIL